MHDVLLQVKNLSVHFGHTQVLHDVHFHVKPHEILILMGPNGAGKTVLLKSIFGLFPKNSDFRNFEVKFFKFFVKKNVLGFVYGFSH